MRRRHNRLARRAHEAATATTAHATRLVIVVAIGLTLLATAGVAIGGLIRSPQQAAADASPPATTVLSAEVVRTTVRDSVVLRGSIKSGRPVAVAAPTKIMTTSIEDREAAHSVVSKTPAKRGDLLRAGAVAIEVSGRPVIVLPGPVPAYRDLRPGDEGPDVRQLQLALATMGLFRDDASGVYGQATKTAVRDLYRAGGYEPVEAAPLGEGTVAEAYETLRHARVALDDARRAKKPPTSPDPLAPTEPPAGADDSSAAATTIEQAQAAALRAQAAYDRAIRSSGAMIPLGEIAFVPAMPARVVSVGGRVGQTLTDEALVLDSGTPLAEAHAEPGQVAGVRPGQVAELTVDAGDHVFTAKVAAVGNPTTDEQTGAQQVTVSFKTDKPLPKDVAEGGVEVRIDQAASEDNVLAVPIAAVTARADNSTYVTKLQPDGRQVQLNVATGVVGDGLVEVSPTPVDDLQPGDRVVTGR